MCIYTNKNGLEKLGQNYRWQSIIGGRSSALMEKKEAVERGSCEIVCALMVVAAEEWLPSPQPPPSAAGAETILVIATGLCRVFESDRHNDNNNDSTGGQRFAFNRVNRIVVIYLLGRRFRVGARHPRRNWPAILRPDV